MSGCSSQRAGPQQELQFEGPGPAGKLIYIKMHSWFTSLGKVPWRGRGGVVGGGEVVVVRGGGGRYGGHFVSNVLYVH